MKQKTDKLGDYIFWSIMLLLFIIGFIYSRYAGEPYFATSCDNEKCNILEYGE